MEHITSATNGKIKLAASLLQRKNRDKQGLFLAEGLRNVELIVETGNVAKIKHLFLTEALLSNDRLTKILEVIEDHKVLIITEELLNKISDSTTPQGVVVIMEQPGANWDNFTGEGPLLILDQVMDPGNVGTIIRCGDALGARGIVALKGSADIFAPKVIRSAMGSIFAKPIMQNVTLEALENYITKQKIDLYLADLDDQAKPLPAVNLRGKVAIVLGNEANGISNALKEKNYKKLYIPMVGNAESLNVAMACAIIMYEYERQLLKLTD